MLISKIKSLREHIEICYMTLHKGYADWIFIYMTKKHQFCRKTEPSTEETTGENNNNTNAVINTVKYENLRIRAGILGYLYPR